MADRQTDKVMYRMYAHKSEEALLKFSTKKNQIYPIALRTDEQTK